MSNDRTIVMFTDNSLDEKVASTCSKKLLLAAAAAGDVPIVCVSQKPLLDFGRNICTGEIGRSHLSLFKQLAIGIEAANTPIVVMAEHDCLYTTEHIGWRLPALDVFYYNTNVWYLQYGGRRNGMFTYHRRRALSQLIVGRDIALRAARERVELLESGYTLVKGAAGACEPGCLDDKAFIPPDPATTHPYNKDLGKDPTKWKAERFATQLPNVDIRHGGNFSGGRRGTDSCYVLAPWGRLEDILKES